MKIASSESQAARSPRHNEPVIFFSISGQTFAINAHAIHEIRSTDSISAAASEISGSTIANVGHALNWENKTYFVVNGCAHFGLPLSRAEHVLILRNSRIALLVNAIERMGAMSVLMALNPGFSGPERSWYRGMTLIDDRVIPVVNPNGLLSKEEIQKLDTGIATGNSGAESFLPSESVAPRGQLP